MATSNNMALKFLISPFLVYSFVFCLLAVMLSASTLPIEFDFPAYLPGIFLLTFIATVAILFHPPFLAKIFSEQRMEKLSEVYHTRDILIAFLILLLFMLFIQPICYIGYILTNNLPMLDARLNQIDQMLGLNWFAYFQWVHDNPMIIPVLDIAYQSMNVVLAVSLVVLRLINRIDRAFVLLHSFIVTALICVTLGAFFPALGATTFLISDLSLFPNFQSMPGSYAVSAIESLRAASDTIVFNPNEMPGLVTFPSFHTAGTIAIAFAFRRTALEIPMWIYTVVVVASTPVFGGHYLIDLCAGAAIGFAVCTVVEKWMYQRRAAYFPNESAPAGRIYSSPVTT